MSDRESPIDMAVVETGVANLASVLAGLRRAGAAPRLTQAAEVVARARAVVLPGVGSFGAAMERLEALDLVDTLRRRLVAGRPTLAICLGMQLLAAGSDESPGVVGLSVFDATVRPFRADRATHMGWNRVSPHERWGVMQEGYAYFANSYRLLEAPTGWTPSITNYGGPFISALERGPVLACQFHPELSGAWGAALLARWVELASRHGVARETEVEAAC
ncbi:MAG: imidazole glycerol phosphate synthase subunit HisH [Phycisphaerales bacterium]